MSKTLIALAVIAAATIAADQPELQIGAAFDAPDDIADKLVANGQAKLSDAPAAATATKAKAVKARVLVAGEYGLVNDLVELPPGAAKQAEAAGLIDSDKAAVAYAASLPQNQPKAA